VAIASGATFDVSAASGFAIGSSQTLSGVGTVAGAISIAGTHSPGSSPGLQTFGDSIVFLVSLRYGIGGFARRDRIALVLAGAGLLLWYLADAPLLALWIALGIDAAGVFLTVRKSMEHPGTESDAAWILTALAGLFGFFSVDPGTPSLFVYPAYIFLAGAVILVSSHPGYLSWRVLSRTVRKRKTAG